MSLRTQFIKSTLCVILYIAVCTLLLKIRQQLYSVSFLKSNQSAENCSVVSQAITKPIGLETKLLEYDEMQESLLLLQQISNTCNKYNLKTPLIRRHFLYNSKQQSIYCWIRKAASTSFTKLFSDMKNRRVMRNYYREVDILAPETLKELYYIANDPKVFKLLIVRHPFQRLVSSYRDRIEDNSKHTAQAWMYTKQIFHLTRPALFHSNITTGNFQQKVFTTDKRLKLVPTFKEFLLWLLQSSDQDDVHWDRYNTHCGTGQK
ncbi:hypothetical protein WN55_07591 [Dufourea novaeangliae]|uniref:Carbohydrate sulfotransferase n=1 Tax=Dufourea novaeangliae TaxID=178035 RepID=A0A154P2G4_DUFNO|nr:hypothetical protein WN55_07591 [Dufourea novaeangliae]